MKIIMVMRESLNAKLRVELAELWSESKKNYSFIKFFEKLKTHIHLINDQIDSDGTFLHKAARFGDTIILRALLELGASPHETNQKNEQPIHLAYKSSNPNKRDLAAILVQFMVYFDHQDNVGKGIIHYAIEFDQQNMVEYLASRGADLNLKDLSQKTPLHLAVVQNKIDIVKILLASKVKIHSLDRIDNSSVYYATNRIKNLLIKAGAKTNLYARLLFHAKIHKKQLDVLNKLADNANLKANKEDLDILNINLLFRDQNIISLMLEAKAYSPSREKRRVKNHLDNYQPFLLVDEEVIENFFHFINLLKTNNTSFLYNFIFLDRDLIHYTPVQILFDEDEIDGKVRIFFVEPAGNRNNYGYIEKLYQASGGNAEIYFHSGGIQKIPYGCPIFAIRILNQLANMDLESKVRNISLVKTISELYAAPDETRNKVPEYIDMRLLRDMQSTRTFVEILEKNSHKPLILNKKGDDAHQLEGDAYRYFLKTKSEEELSKLSSCNKHVSYKQLIEKQNHGILAVAAKYSQRALEKYLELDAGYNGETISNVIRNRQSFRSKNTYPKIYPKSVERTWTEYVESRLNDESLNMNRTTD